MARTSQLALCRLFFLRDFRFFVVVRWLFVLYVYVRVLVSFAFVFAEQKASKINTDDSSKSTSAFAAPGRYPDYFLADEDFLSAKSSRLMDYDMESKVQTAQPMAVEIKMSV